MDKKNISRRSFLRVTGITGTALCLGIYFSADGKERKVIVASSGQQPGIEMNAWIRIDRTGLVTLTDHRAEMGQGSYQSVPQIIAEELEVNLKDVKIIFAQGDPKKYGSQMTGGSSTISDSYKDLLRLSATARILLISAAAAQWKVAISECYAKSGNVIHRLSGKTLHYGELVDAASKLEAPKNIILKKRGDYKLIGKPLPRKDTPIKTNGVAIFGIDKKLPGMLYAVVERNPRFRGKVKSFDDAATKMFPGVKHVFIVKMNVWDTIREGVAVVADSTWAAMQGRKLLSVIWDDHGFEHLNTADIYKRQQDQLKLEGLSYKKQGMPDSILAASLNTLDVIYQTPYQAHSAMEPVNCIASYEADKIEIWGPIQAPDWVQGDISKKFNMPIDQVRVNMTFLGGAFGRKAFLDYPHEATVISKKIGKPVQVVWTREDDTRQGPYRAGISYRAQGAIVNGEVSTVKFRMAGQNINHWTSTTRGLPNSNTMDGFSGAYFDTIKNISFNDVPFETPIPNMWWRSVYASTNGFAYESFINELAHALGQDPLQFRRSYLKEDRYQKLIDKMEEVSDWKFKTPNEGYGIAITECFSTIVGQIVKVSRKTNGKVTIDQVWAVLDCGWYVNPDIIKAQVEGSIVMGLGAATIHQITFKDGMTEQHNFYDYLMPRITDIPLIEVHIMENDADAGGVGEPALPAFAPALTEAIFDLTGNRIRKLPFNLNTI